MAGAIVSGNASLTALTVPPVAGDCGELRGLVTIDVTASAPEFGVHHGDMLVVDFDQREVRCDGLFLISQGDWTGIRRFQRVPQPITPLGLRIKIDSDTRWTDVTPGMAQNLTIIGHVKRVFRGETVG